MGERKAIITILLILSLAIYIPMVCATEDSWTILTPMPTARGGSGVAVVNDKIYVIGGSTESGLWPSIHPSTIFGNQDIDNFVDVNEVYDPVLDQWELKEPMPTPRGVFSIAIYQKKIYCIGGKTNEGISEVNEVYDPMTDTWETKASIPMGIFESEANVIGNKIYVIAYSGSNYVYDPAEDLWITKTAMPNEAFNYASAVVDQTIFVFSGFTSNLTQIYNTETDIWSLGSAVPSVVAGGATGITTGIMAPIRIYVFGYPVPVSVGAPLFYTQVYNPENDSWIDGANMPTKRVGFGVAVVNDTLYTIGGHTYDTIGFLEPSNINEHYTPIGYIPEFPSWAILPLFLTVTLIGILVIKRVMRTRTSAS